MVFTLPTAGKVAGVSTGLTSDLNNLYTATTAVTGVNVCNSTYAGGADPTGAADSTSAIQAAITAAAAAGRGVYVPAGTYKCNTTALLLNVPMFGDGHGSQIQWDATLVPTLIKGPGASPSQYVNIRDMRFSQTNAAGGGTCIDASLFQFSDINRVLIDSAGSGKSPNTGVLYNASQCHYNVLRNSVIFVDGANATGVSYTGPGGGSNANSNVLRNCRIIPSNSDATQTGIYVNAYAIELDHPDIENFAGAAIKIDAQATSNRPTTIIAEYIEPGAGGGTPVSVVNGGCPPAYGASRFTLVKPSATARASTSTLANDPDLQFTALIGKTYRFDCLLIMDGPTS